jgi:hypothetical protein
MNEERFKTAIAAIDAANSGDPNEVADGGVNRPAALVYGERMSATLERLYPDASELLRLGARAQHIQRWTVPRSNFPMDRAGYLQWRNHLKRLHADWTGEIMGRCGYGNAEITRVQSLLRKENFKRDPDAQALEDAACIVFLHYYATEFGEKHDDEKMTTILRKTWIKMSEKGQQAALALQLPEKLRRLIRAALAA